MNPAALKVHLSELLPGGIIIVNENAFSPKNLKLAGYESNPLEDGTVESYELYSIQMSTLVAKACEGMDISPKTVDRTKNMFALGLLYWIYNRPLEPTIKWLGKKFAKRPELVDSNVKALNAGYNYGETVEIFSARYNVDKAPLPEGKYRNINGNYAASVGLLAGSIKANIPLFYGGYPITPASDILHTLASFRHFGVKTFQAEDEIAGITSAIGSSFAGNLAVTASSGPGIALKAEAIGLAVIAELPLVIVNVQRGGPSTGLPTKTEQSDLFQALYGRNGEAPVPVIAAQTPGDCFYAAFEACQVAIKYRTPVFLLTDGYLANGSEPWSIPNFDDLPSINPNFAEQNDDLPFLPYARDKKTLARPWAIPGTVGLEHRIGGLEKEDQTGNVSYDPENHHKMTELREQKVQKIVNDIPKTEVLGKKSGDTLILSWGGTYGSCRSATERLQNDGKKVSHVHLRWINPLPKDLGEILIRFKNIVIPELNMGQLSKLIRADYLVDAVGLNLVKGRPFKASDIVDKVKELKG
jgi:2-oxoglutarate ferredoxin oxidoreductase subunit alpha